MRRWADIRIACQIHFPRIGAIGDELFRRVIHLDDAGPMQTRWKSARSRGADFEMAARLRRADGAYRWHLLRAVPVPDQIGRA